MPMSVDRRVLGLVERLRGGLPGDGVGGLDIDALIAERSASAAEIIRLREQLAFAARALREAGFVESAIVCEAALAQ